MLSSRTIITLLTLNIVLFGCGLDPDGIPQREGNPGSSTIFVGDTDPEQPAANEAQPGDSPATQPGPRVRVAMVVDISQSMNITDPSGLNGEPTARERAAKEVVMTHLLHKDAAFAFIPFNGQYPLVNAGLDDGFTKDAAVILGSAPSTLGQGQGVSDYQTALTVTRNIIAADVATSTEEELARTTYTVIFVADGNPSLVCKEGCNGDGICDELREQWCADPTEACEGRDDCGPPRCSWWPLLEQCGAYNTPQLLQELSAEISSLSEAATIRMNTVLMINSQTPAWVHESPRGLLTGMAAAGGGVYLEVSDMSQLSFTNPMGL